MSAIAWNTSWNLAVEYAIAATYRIPDPSQISTNRNPARCHVCRRELLRGCGTSVYVPKLHGKRGDTGYVCILCLARIRKALDTVEGRRRENCKRQNTQSTSSTTR